MKHETVLSCQKFPIGTLLEGRLKYVIDLVAHFAERTVIQNTRCLVTETKGETKLNFGTSKFYILLLQTNLHVESPRTLHPSHILNYVQTTFIYCLFTVCPTSTNYVTWQPRFKSVLLSWVITIIVTILFLKLHNNYSLLTLSKVSRVAQSV